ncbi:MAG TPA: uracil phosphoribosyltransferase [Kiritimatiellia bacterium]|nr:uracil phosphoribosyltransferase [Kiritimatiellia bacterium]HRZ12851.1 uracil phosphoribosyltransferase [Kiritimatiellia bacterium]HSA18197.1 uracil phosphoribosyltransferase [Kiritimatiellia bacterium]
MRNVFEIRHPLVQHHLARLRDRDTGPAEFRRLLQRLSALLAYEATQDLVLQDTTVQTPLAPARGRVVRQRIGVVPILRAGLGMVDPIVNLIPDAEVWHLGFYRDEKTLQPIEYYRKLPQGDPVDVSLVLDPMLATGGSAVAALEAVHAWGVKTVKLLAMLASPEGVRRVHQQFPDMQLYVCAIDERLNEHGFILPGLGDAGDRMFNARAAS